MAESSRRDAGTPRDLNQISGQIVDAALHLHTRLGPGLLESVYTRLLAHELEKPGLNVRREVPVPLVYDGIRFDEGFRADLIVEDSVLVELKSVEALAPVHSKQVLTLSQVAGLPPRSPHQFRDAAPQGRHPAHRQPTLILSPRLRVSA